MHGRSQSDLDDSVGYWYVQPTGAEECRVYYACDTTLRGWVQPLTLTLTLTLILTLTLTPTLILILTLPLTLSRPPTLLCWSTPSTSKAGYR